MKPLLRTVCVFCVLMGVTLSTYSQIEKLKDIQDINLLTEYLNFTSWAVSEHAFIYNDAFHWEKRYGDEFSSRISRHRFGQKLKSEYSDGRYLEAIEKIRKSGKFGDLMVIIDSVQICHYRIVNNSSKLLTLSVSGNYKKDSLTTFNHLVDVGAADFLHYYQLYLTFKQEIKAMIGPLRTKTDNPVGETALEMWNLMDDQQKLLFEWSVFFSGGKFPYELQKEVRDYNDSVLVSFKEKPELGKDIHNYYKAFYSYIYNTHQRLISKTLGYYEEGTLMDFRDFTNWELITAFNSRCVNEYNAYLEIAAERYQTFLPDYPREPLLFTGRVRPPSLPFVDKSPVIVTEVVEIDPKPRVSLEGYAENRIVLLLDISGSMNQQDKLPLLKESFGRLLNDLRPEDYVSIVVYSGGASQMLAPTSCAEKSTIREILKMLKGGGSTNFPAGITLAYESAAQAFSENGNNRIIVATDGVFQVDRKIIKEIRSRARNGISLSVFHFGAENTNKELKKLADYGKGNYAIIQADNIDEKLIREVQAISVNADNK